MKRPRHGLDSISDGRGIASRISITTAGSICLWRTSEQSRIYTITSGQGMRIGASSFLKARIERLRSGHKFD